MQKKKTWESVDGTRRGGRKGRTKPPHPKDVSVGPYLKKEGSAKVSRTLTQEKKRKKKKKGALGIKGGPASGLTSGQISPSNKSGGDSIERLQES